MRKSLILSFVLLILTGSVFADSVSKNSDIGTSDLPPTRLLVPQVSYSKSIYSTASMPVRLALEGLVLTADSGQLMHDVEFSASTMYDSLASLQQGMVNLTSGAKAYRLLPHGEHFSSPATLQLAYEPMALPHGFRQEDIYTYYYNEEKSHWVQLERINVDTVNHIVVSQTTHFTDFINAVIHTPEIPEVKAFVPTQINEMEEPNPLVGVPMIPEPQANSHGTMELTYPIDIPAGRNGIQPNINLSYSSANGNGILGYGWSIPQPAISIDTRWGVPRYDADYETEIYSLDGVQLVQRDSNPDLTLPYQTHTLLPRVTGDIVFAVRDIQRADVVERHGTNPSDYWWSVTARDGSISYYGKYTTIDSDSHPSVLRDANGNIGYWALTEVVDVNGNYMRYEYTVSSDKEIYPKNIYYTGHISNDNDSIDLKPSYRVFFHYREHDNKPSDGRLGFIRRTDSLICYIDVANINLDAKYTNHRYIIHYHDSLPERQITKINDFPYSGTYKWPISGDCYSDINGFFYGPIVNSCVDFRYYNPSPAEMFGPEHVISGMNQPLMQSMSDNWNVGGAVTLGIGFNYIMSSLGAGGNYNYSHSSSISKNMLLDMNGDGLTDMVFIQNDTICYRLQHMDGDSAWFRETHSTGIPAKGLNTEKSSTHTWGLQANAGISDILGANISGGEAYTNSYTESYFADINGDGLPDYITEGKIYFNRINSYGNFVNFNGENEVIIDSTQCTTNFYYDGEVEVIPDCYERDTIVATYVYVEPDCSLGAHGTDPEEYYIDMPDSTHCEECDNYIIEYIQSGECPIDLHSLYLRRRGRPSVNRSDTVSSIYESLSVESPLEEKVLYCLWHCNVELPCPECLDFYHVPGREEEYEQCKQTNGCRTLCSKCVHHLYAGEEPVYLQCMDQYCLDGSLYTVSTPCLDCEQTCVDDLNNCKECIYNNPACMVCEECEQDCAISIEDCLICKRDHNCRGGALAETCFSECYETGADPFRCQECIVANGLYCEECADTCLLYPELCRTCVDRHCYMDEAIAHLNECYQGAANALNTWKAHVRSQYDHITFVREGNRYYAHMIDTICPEPIDPEIEAVRVWVAPRKGTITLTSVVHLIEDTTISRIQSRSVDGVKCVIQHSHGIRVDTDDMTLHDTIKKHLATIDIDPDDYSPHSSTYSNVNVNKGDILFFHLRSIRTHNFDNVDWQQVITYNDSVNAHYSSSEDFVCASEEVFQNDRDGTLSIAFNINCAVNNSAVLEIHNANSTDTILITPSLSNTIRTLSYSADSLVYFVLSPVSGNLGSIEVQAHLYFVPLQTDSLHNPYDTWMTPRLQFNRPDSLSSIYFDLFGPLYRGWGQFAYNNTDATELIPLGSLRNESKFRASALSSSNNYTQDSTAYIDQLNDIISDSTHWQQTGGLTDLFANQNIYNPTEGAWIQMNTDAYAYRWEAYGRVARSGRRLLSNTRELMSMVNSVSDTLSAAISPSPDIIVYDSDVPVMTGQRTTTVRKATRTRQWNVNAGINIGGAASVGAGRTFSKSNYTVSTDFMDMNGDRYPDVVRPQKIQYTQPWGGLGNIKVINKDISYTNQAETMGKSVSGGYAYSEKVPGTGVKNPIFSTHATGGLSGNSTITENGSILSYMDMNGDGLPDILTVNGDSVQVSLNKGYDFESPYTLVDIPHIDKSHSDCMGVGLSGGFTSLFDALHSLGQATAGPLRSFSSTCQLSITLGVDASGSHSYTDFRLVDMDGDGLPDIVRQGNGVIYVGFAKPRGVVGSAQVNHPVMQESATSSWALNAGLTAGFPIYWFIKMTIGANGSFIGQSYSQSDRDLIDMDGDGLPDLVWRDSDGLHVRYNQMGRKRLLRSVSNTTSQIYEIDYELSAPSIEQRGRQWQMSELRNIIPQNGVTSCDTMAYRFIYADPHYNHAERTAMGYGSVETYDLRTDTVDRPVYRKHKRHYNNTDFIYRGQLTYEALTDSTDHRYTEYRLDSITFVNGQGEQTDHLCQRDAEIRVREEAHIITYFSPEENDSIVTTKQYDYDKYHNVITYRNQGDITTSEDDIRANITYADATSGSLRMHNLVSLPTRVDITAAGTQGRMLKANYDDLGHLVSSCIAAPSGADSSVTDFLYNEYGLPSQCILPPNHNEERASVNILYDDYSKTLPWKLTDHWGRTYTTEYHPFWQKPVQVTDAAGTSIRYTYDNIGRVQMVHTWLDSTETAYTNWYGYSIPYEAPMATLRYEYIPCMQLRRENPYVRTTAIGRYQEGVMDTIFSIAEYDRRGRLLQRKEKREGEWRVNSITATDCFGRTTAEYRPFFTTSDTTALYSNNLHLHATTDYDIMDRPIRINRQDNTHQSFIYDIEADASGIKRLLRMLVDEKSQTWREYSAPQEWITMSVAPDSATTSFVYDALGQLLSSTDPDSLTTTYMYDAYGRRTQRTHPDAGTTRWIYDPAGNIVASATQQQINDNTQTTYEYEYDRLMTVHQSHSELDVSYEYDSVGRIVSRTDITGIEQFTYDQMGNVVRTNRLVVIPSDNQAYLFETNYQYDIFGRIKRLNLPDGSRIDYQYGYGLLKAIGRIYTPTPHHGAGSPPAPRPQYYLRNCTYDEYDRLYDYDHGSYHVELGYSQDRLWLTNKTTYNTSHTLQELDYAYDAVGNITSTEQFADSVQNLGGAYTQAFRYDAQNRLKGADMTSDYMGQYSNYNMTYSPSGRIDKKQCSDMSWTYWHGYCGVNNKIINHQVRSIYDMTNDATTYLMWDAAGRLQDVYDPCAGYLRHHWWNETGQMAAMVDNGHCAFYGYDGNGERTYKLTGTTSIDQYNAGEETFHMNFNDAVIYVNPYFTITPRNYTSHIMNGSQRIATRIGTNSLTNCIDTTNAGAERIANARAYMQTLFAQGIELRPDTTATFVTNAGNSYDELQWQCVEDDLAWDITMQCDSDLLLTTSHSDSIFIDTVSSGIYYYYTDHLGSASWITEGGEPVQYIHYMPYGELWRNQRNTTYDERYKFTGKERDAETGYDYFGARNYSSAITSWLSVDPLSDKYPSVSPYAYCAWNPVKHVDPDGRDWYETEDGQIKWTQAHSQDEMMQLNIEGKYLDKVVLDFKGSRYETLGWKYPGMDNYDEKHTYGYIDGLFSITADVTLYGPNGENDITCGMIGYTMTSDYSTFGAIDDGGYPFIYKSEGKPAPLPSHWMARDPIPELDHKPNYSPKAGRNYGLPQKTGIYLHSTNQSGFAGVTIWNSNTGRPLSGISVGCPLLSPKDFSFFNKKMEGLKSFWLRISR